MAYIPTTDSDRTEMLDCIGASSVDELFAPIPDDLQVRGLLDIPPAFDQISLTNRYIELGLRNADSDRYPTFLGAGVYDHYVPPTVGAIIGRSEFYTAYTPYQPEVSQGTLQSIYEFQTLIAELTGMDIANASMYDASTGLAEAAIMASEIKNRKKVLALGTLHPTYLQVLQTYLSHVDVELHVIEDEEGVANLDRLKAAATHDVAAIITQHPNFYGNLEDMRAIGDLAHNCGALFVSCFDPISLGIIAPPGAYDVDIAIGEGQALGCPMGFGGPLLGLFACKREYMRRMPGRIVGATRDIEGRRAYVMTLRTREQDIRRERATSNICTNVALYALAATVYLATMGKQGMRQVAELCVQKAHYAAARIAATPGFALTYPEASFFKEFGITCPVSTEKVNQTLWEHGIIGGYPAGPHELLIAVTERRSRGDIDRLVDALGTIEIRTNERNGSSDAATAIKRTTAAL